ncbi:Pentatricopeptide repeat [Melia azedarach]|uniref:Pentatricopeptide repeat n=1 Tax=Melia azedarach TaxID=155640 RepID=A0ACC1YQP2_MELAZ|nr:Pentatricopeptide repeat [Melia azedarach]
MAFPSKLCLSDSFPIPFPYPVKDRVKLKKCNCSTTCMAAEPFRLNADCKLFDKSSKRVGLLTSNLNCDGYTDGEEKVINRNGYFTRYVSSHDNFNDDECSNNVPVTCYSSQSFLNERFVINVLSFCAREGYLELGRRYHALILKTGVGKDQFVRTSLVDMYAKCGNMDSAVMLVNQMPHLDIASCNCLLSGYANNGLLNQAFSFFLKFDSMDIMPNHYTYSTILSICGYLSAIKEGKQLHAQTVKMQYLSKTAVGNALLTMYIKCGMMVDAESLFEGLVRRNVISWTAIINGFKQHRDFEKALRLVCLMREDGIDPNEYTFTDALASCARMKNLNRGRMFHAQVIKRGMALGNFVGTAIVDMYSRLGESLEAKKQLREMGKSASNVPWNAQIAGFVRNEKVGEAIEAFSEMVRNDAACDVFTYSAVLRACSLLSSLSTCEQIHSRIVKSKFESNMHVGSSLIEAYNKCGRVEDAERVFSQMSAADVVSWNSMIKAYSQNGYPGKAIILFQKMVEEGIKPTNSSFLAVLSACSHSGLVEEGQKIFESMVTEYSILPEETHYGCMVDLLGRAGQLENALNFINNLTIKPTALIWRPLLAACRCHRNLQMAEFVAKQILELDPDDAAVYVTLSNIYAEAGQFADADKQRKLMKQKEVVKEPGCSWIEVNKKIYRFYSRDKSHTEMPEVYLKLKQVTEQIEDNGHTLKEKEDIVLYHSERLAVCFGLISLPAKKQIRVFKNLRVCRDCHSFMKYVSIIMNQDIVLRDNYRFHHFKQGSCSCGDYW